MHVHFSYKNTEKTEVLIKLINRRVAKVDKLLATFAHDLVHLHGSLERPSPREGFVTSLNLRLPIGQIYATEKGRAAQVSLRAAFDELERQVNKQKGLLRGDGKYVARTMVETGEAEARLPKQPPKRPRRRSMSLTSI